MAEPWLSVIGLGEDGADGLSPASRAALEAAEVVFGPPRHLALLSPLDAELVAWPAPFADGLPLLLAKRGRRVAMLVSGDPFWFGAGSIIAEALPRAEWRAFSAHSCFALAAARLGWRLERTACLGLHAAPLTRLRPALSSGARVLATLRDGAAVGEAAGLLRGWGFGASTCHVLEALGGPRERLRAARADALDFDDIAHPVALGIEAAGGPALPRAPGLRDDLFEHDGQISKSPIRALTLSALVPCPGERLWDIGAGSGSVGIEWLLSHPSTEAVAIERDPARAARARANAARLGVDRLQLVEGAAPEALQDLPAPDAVFIGGGLSEALLGAVWAALPTGARLVANAVTLDSEALLAAWRGAKGGDLLRIEMAEAVPLGGKTGWRPARPIVQWRVST